MPLFSRILSRVSPSLLRTIRNRLFLDLERIGAALPPAGRVLEVGCGYGHVISRLAESRPDLEFVGVDPDEDAIARARAVWKSPNLRFVTGGVESLGGEFDLVLLLDVIHHLPRGQEGAIVDHCARLLAPGGRLLVKEMPKDDAAIGIFLDTYVSRCPPLVRTDDEIRDVLTPAFEIVDWKTSRQLAIGHLYVLAGRR